MEMMIKNYKVHNYSLSFSIKNKEINGITGNLAKDIEEIVFLKNEYDGKIIINNEEIKSDEILKYKKQISIIKDDFPNNYYNNNVYELMYYEIRRRRITLKDPTKKIINSLKIVGLNINIIYKKINILSSSEKRLVKLAIGLLSNPDTIIIEEPFKHMDKNNEKKLIMLFQKMKEQYNKTIIFISDDIYMLYKYTTHLIISKKNKIIVEGKTNKIIEDVDFLIKNKINIPSITEITYLARKNKDVKIEYHKDIRDIIKDIYKHVQR